MSDENRVRIIASQPIRGKITDKNGIILADSKLKYSLKIKPSAHLAIYDFLCLTDLNGVH